MNVCFLFVLKERNVSLLSNFPVAGSTSHVSTLSRIRFPNPGFSA